MKFAFTTCVQLGKSVLEKIYELGGRFEFLVTLRDEKTRNKSGRIYLDDIANAYEIPLIKVDNVNNPEVLAAVKKYEIDWLFIIGWSQIAGKELLMAPRRGCIGMHPTLLPEGRGSASIPWAILKGLDRTGVTMFQLDDGVDTGDILGQFEIPLHSGITATELYGKVNAAHVSLIEKYWDSIVKDDLILQRQDDCAATEWPRRRPKDGELFETMTMQEAERMVRAVTRPYPGAFFYQDGKKVTVWSAEVSSTASKVSFKVKDGYLLPIEYEVEPREIHTT